MTRRFTESSVNPLNESWLEGFLIHALTCWIRRKWFSKDSLNQAEKERHKFVCKWFVLSERITQVNKSVSYQSLTYRAALFVQLLLTDKWLLKRILHCIGLRYIFISNFLKSANQYLNQWIIWFAPLLICWSGFESVDLSVVTKAQSQF